MTYFDPGYIAKCYVAEAQSREVRALAEARDRIACSEFGRTELRSALHLIAAAAHFGLTGRSVSPDSG